MRPLAALEVGDAVKTWFGPAKAVLFAILIIGVAGLAEGRQSSALFTAQATNPGNTFQVGTLRMSNSRSGSALFSTSGADAGVASSTMSIVAATGSFAYLPASVGANVPNPLPTDSGFQISGTGGALPGVLLVNSVTIGNIGTLAAGAVNLSVPSITVSNNAAANCDPSNALVVNGVDTCGRGRLTDVMRLTAYYLTGDGKAVCVVGSQAGSVVTAANDGQAIVACGNPAASLASATFNATFGVPITRNAANVSGGAFGLADSTAPLTIPIATTTGDRIEPAFASVPVWSYRSGAAVRDWAVGETRAITFALFLDPAADNRYQGARASIDLKWDSTSLSGAVVVTPVPAVSTGSVSGTLTNTSGPLSAQQISLFSMGSSPVYATSGADGSYTFSSVAPGNYSVVAWVDSVPLVKSVTVTAGQVSTVPLAATAVDRQLAVTISPAPSSGSPWTSYVLVSGAPLASATNSFRMSFAGQPTSVASASFAAGYRSADAANTTVNMYTGSSQQMQSSPPDAQYMQSLAAAPTTLSVSVPTLTVSGFACTTATCTATLSVTGAPTGAVVSAFLVPSASPYSMANPSTVQSQTAGASVPLSFARPAGGTYVMQVSLVPAGSSSSSQPAWSWNFRTSTHTVATP